LLHQVDLGAQAAGVVGFQWDGITDSGASAAAGSYSVAVAATQGGKQIDASALASGLVSGVIVGKSGVMLNLNGVGPVALADVKLVM
jgi:flagellar basal-body rod modification protein FlgD